VKDRARRLRKGGSPVGATRSCAGRNRVLVEKPGLGRTRCFAQVGFAGGTAEQLIRVRIEASDARILRGRVAGTVEHEKHLAVA
jgi:hypothetical protein